MVRVVLTDKIALFPAAMLNLRLKHGIAFKIAGGTTKSNQSYRKAKSLIDDIEKCFHCQNFEIANVDDDLFRDLIIFNGRKGWYDLGADIESEYHIFAPDFRIERLGKVMYLSPDYFDSVMEFARCIGDMSSCKLIPYRI